MSQSAPLESGIPPQLATAVPSAVAAVTRLRRPGPKRICLFGLFGMDNYGNDGSLEAMLMFLRATWPDAVLSCVCIDPDRVERSQHVPSVPIRWHGLSNRTLRLLDKLVLTLPQKVANWLHAIWHMRKFDLLIVPGTSTLCDYRADPFGAPYALFRWAVAARLCGAKLYFVSTGAGPIQHWLSRWMLTYAGRSAVYRSFRDKNSKDFLTGLGIDTRHDAVYPDIAFKLPVPDLPASSTLPSDPPTIAVGLIDYNGWDGHSRPDDSIYETYLAKITRFVGDLLKRGYRVRLLVGEIADWRAVAGLRVRLAATRRDGGPDQLVTEPVRDLADLMAQLADSKIVVASRFHNVVCALRLARPTISLGYQPKNDALMAEFDLAEYCQHIEHFDSDLLMQHVDEQLANTKLYEDRIRRKLSNILCRITEQEEVLAQIL